MICKIGLPFLNLGDPGLSKQDENYSKEILAKFDKLLAGNTDNLPHLPRSVVRIFISSTFSGKN